MKFLLVTYVLNLAMLCFIAEATTKKLIDTIHVCDRDDPDLSECIRLNVNNVIPKLKGGAPSMNVVPLDPAVVKHVNLDFRQTRHMNLEANLENVTIYGLGKGHAVKCEAFENSDGIQVYLDMRFPQLILKSLYQMEGHFMLIVINASSDFIAEFTDVAAQFVWNSTVYMKNNVEHLIYTGEIINLTTDKMVIHFHNLLGNNTRLNEDIDRIINDNIQMLYEEVKPVVWKTVLRAVAKIANDFHRTFSYDVLYPK